MNNIYTSIKYIKWYFGIILNAKQRTIDPNVKYDRHHITPKCMGGPDTKYNLVHLTYKEHFICHRLLVKITQGKDKSKMANAIWRMCSGNKGINKRYKITSRTYSSIKEQFSEFHRKGKTYEEIYGIEKAKELREKRRIESSGRISPKKGKTYDELYGIEKSIEIREKGSNSLKGSPGGFKGKKHSDLSKQKNRESNTGKRLSEGTKQKMSKSATELWALRNNPEHRHRI